MSEIRLGFAVCGSFCTFSRTLTAMEECKRQGFSILPILSPAAAATDTRFGKAADFLARVTGICGCPPILDLPGAEPIGPQNKTDLLLVAPAPATPLPNWQTESPTTR